MEFSFELIITVDSEIVNLFLIKENTKIKVLYGVVHGGGKPRV